MNRVVLFARCSLLALVFVLVGSRGRSLPGAEPASSDGRADRIAAGVSAGLPERFTDGAGDAVPDFQKHVMPLFGRLGCNGRACHGSFQGRGGFQLSLFGYDFAADYKASMEASAGRVDLEDVDESLILAKPIDAEMHAGGQRFQPGSWQNHVLRAWVADGAKFDRGQPAVLRRLEVRPSELVFAAAAQAVPLQVIAHWADGSSEDVTALSRYMPNDEAVATVDEAGRVRSGSVGDTPVVIAYDKAVVPVAVMHHGMAVGRATAKVDQAASAAVKLSIKAMPKRCQSGGPGVRSDYAR